MWYLEVRGGYGGLPGLRRGSPVAIVDEVAHGVGPLGPGPEGLVVRAPDAGPDGDSQPRDAHRAQAVDVDSAALLQSTCSQCVWLPEADSGSAAMAPSDFKFL